LQQYAHGTRIAFDIAVSLIAAVQRTSVRPPQRNTEPQISSGRKGRPRRRLPNLRTVIRVRAAVTLRVWWGNKLTLV
jgi:hypothetical protein